MEWAATEINDLKVQREYLIDKVVLGQRLALARCRFSMSHCLQKGFERFRTNCFAGANDEAIGAI